MKLRNKKTGEIVIASITRAVSGVDFDCGATLAKLNEEWEDYEEPKEYYYLSNIGLVRRLPDEDTNYDKFHRLIGNYFLSREEAERAVEKLKAWKRLKDKGFKFLDHIDRDSGQGMTRYEWDSYIDGEDLDLLFGTTEDSSATGGEE